MLSIGEINLFVSDFRRALRFWAEGLGLEVAEREELSHTAHARLDFADGSPSLRLFWPVPAWPDRERPEYGERPMIGFDVITDEFDERLERLVSAGGVLAGEIQDFQGQRYVFIADPDGNTFELVEVSSDET
jgi:catechol 2,3-dioxygenase-like lactoylglutathione lyase family enzyme